MSFEVHWETELRKYVSPFPTREQATTLLACLPYLTMSLRSASVISLSEAGRKIAGLTRKGHSDGFTGSILVSPPRAAENIELALTVVE